MQIPRRSFLRSMPGLAVGLVVPAKSVAAERALRVVTRDGPAIAGPAVRHGRSFARAAGVPVDVVRLPFDRLYEAIMIGFVTGQASYDVLLVPAGWVADFAPYLAPVPERLITGPAFADIHPTYRDALMRWGDRWVAMTIDGDLHIGAYRTDLFADPEHRAAFAARYGRALAPPETWADYAEIAGFFHGRRDAEGRVLAGTAEAFAAGGQRVWVLSSRAAAYATVQNRPAALFFDPETMVPAVDGPAWVRALHEFREALTVAPAGARSMGSYGVRAAFVGGRTAMNIDWTDTGVLAASAEYSAVAGKVGFYTLPGSREAWDPAMQDWRRLRTAHHVPFLAFGGWVAAVPAASRAGDAAWDYVAWLSSPERSARDVADGASGINPYRMSHLNDPALWAEVFPPSQAEDYLGVIRQSLDHPMVARDLRIPGVRAYQAALDHGIGRVLDGSSEPAVALADVAGRWELITDRLGRDAQHRHYRAAMGLDGVRGAERPP